MNIGSYSAGDRARQILGSMRERRENFTDVLRREIQQRPAAVQVTTPFFTAEESAAITKQLKDSLHGRRVLLSRATASIRKRVLDSSSCVSENSTETPSFGEGETLSLSSPQRSLATSYSSQPPTLDDIREAFGEMSITEESSSESGKGSCSSSSSTFEPIYPRHLYERPALSFDETLSRKQPPTIVTAASFDSALPRPVPQNPQKPLAALPEGLNRMVRALSDRQLFYRPNSPLSCASTLSSGDHEFNQRPMYLGNLYSVHKAEEEKAKRDARAIPLREIMEISVVQNNEKRKQLIQMLRRDLMEDSKPRAPRAVTPIPSSPLTLNEEDLLPVSDESSFDGTTTDSTETSGWISGNSSESDQLENSLLSLSSDDEDDDGFNVSLLSSPEDTNREDDEESDAIGVFKVTLSKKLDTILEKVSHQSLHRKVLNYETAETYTTCSDTLDENLLEELKEEAEPSPEPVLFVDEETADSLCRTNGGLYKVAMASGWDEQKPIEVEVLSTTPQKFFFLSTDFRCGAYGSHYDIALRSGCRFEPSEHEEEIFMRASGGQYGLALASGLDVSSKKPYEVTATRLGRRRDLIIPEAITDDECGGRGTLYMALESGLGYVTAGSLYYMAERSGMQLNVA